MALDEVGQCEGHRVLVVRRALLRPQRIPRHATASYRRAGWGRRGRQCYGGIGAGDIGGTARNRSIGGTSHAVGPDSGGTGPGVGGVGHGTPHGWCPRLHRAARHGGRRVRLAQLTAREEAARAWLGLRLGLGLGLGLG